MWVFYLHLFSLFCCPFGSVLLTIYWLFIRIQGSFTRNPITVKRHAHLSPSPELASLCQLHFSPSNVFCFPLSFKGNQESISRNKLHKKHRRMNQCKTVVPLATTYFPFFPRFDFRINMMSDVLTRKHQGQVHIGHFQKVIQDTSLH